jgi:dihydrolipoamide dehydrogenase
MGSKSDYDLVVIGSGPGGYVGAIRAAQLGLKAAVVERERPGGVCLNIGCIPSKALIHQAGIFAGIKDLEAMGLTVDRSRLDYGAVFRKSRAAADRLSKGVQGLLAKNKIDFIPGTGTIVRAGQVSVDGKQTLGCKNILVATGSRSKDIGGFKVDEKSVLSSTGLLMLEKLPKSILILGGGAIGVEFAYVMNAFGVEVHLVEMMPQLLPLEDAEVVAILTRELQKRGIKIATSTKAAGMTDKGALIEVALEGQAKSTVAAEKVLVAVGRTPNTEGLGLEGAGVVLEKGFVKVGDYYQTTAPGIYAVGDIVPTPLLAHVASKEAEIAVEHMAGHPCPRRIDPLSIPGAVYSEPQLASFGYTEEKAKAAGLSYNKASFPYRGAGKAVAVEKPEGMVKILTDSVTKEIIGAHIVGADATELIHELLLARTAELLPEDIATMIHAHPTLSEAVMEAMRTSEGWAIHI